MFKKLKDKIAEEVKSSPQRIQQLTQSVTEKIQNATSDESFFSIGEDDAPTPEPGFSNVSLSNYSTPQSGRVRQNSNSSVASDISFLPRYESSTNLYHVQSDLDISASELEDNASSSSQLGHLSKEQIYAAFQKAQMRYHKYRGRYSDIANYYKELERENAKMKAVLVETQDKALRRVAELREQCSLEQKAKAHLENALRLEIDEKQYVIDTLKTKVNLLQVTSKTSNVDKPELLVSVNEDIPDKNLNNIEILTKDLKDAQTEIENLNDRLQELKANAIVFNSKESEFKKKISELTEINKQKVLETDEILERERENNLIIAQTKMELHTEIQNRDLEIENLKQDVETLKADLDTYENKNKNTKMENLHSQNAKLIEKIETLTQKCKNYESELLKLEQLKIENENLKLINRDSVKDEVIILQNEIESQRLKYEKDLEAYRDDTKKTLLTLEAKIREKVDVERNEHEQELQASFEQKLREVMENSDNAHEIQLKLIEKDDEVKNLLFKMHELESVLQTQRDKYDELEKNHLELITENSSTGNELKNTQKRLRELEEDASKQHGECDRLQNENARRIEEVSHVRSELEKEFLNHKTKLLSLENENSRMHAEFLQLQENNKVLLDGSTDAATLRSKVTRLTENLTALKSENDELKCTVTQLQESLADLTKLHEQLSETNKNLKQEIEEHKNDNNVKEELTKTKEAFQKKIKEQKAKFHFEIQRLNTEISSFKQNNDLIQTHIEEYKQKLNEYETTSAQKATQLQDLLNRNETARKTLQTSEETNIKLSQEIDSMKMLLTQKDEEKTNISVNLQKVTDECTNVKNEMSLKQNELRDEIIRYQTAESAYKEQIRSFENERNEEKIKNGQLLASLNELQENFSKQKGTESQFVKEISSLKIIGNDYKEEKNKLIREKTELCATLAELNEQILKYEENKAQFEKEISNLRATESDYKREIKKKNQLSATLAEFKEQILKHEESKSQLESEISNLKTNESVLKEENVKVVDAIARISAENDELRENVLKYESSLKSIQEEKVEIDKNAAQLQNKMEELIAENQRLREDIIKLHDHSMTHQETLDNYSRSLEEMTELKRRNNELSLDYKQITQENEGLLQDLAETRLKFETLDMDKEKSVLIKSPDFDKQEVDKMANENKKMKTQLENMEEKLVLFEKVKKDLDSQLRELENQYSEIVHERQLLQDEIQEFKISPVNINHSNTEKLENLSMFHGDNTNDIQKIQEDHEKEINHLNEKLIQYKSLDLTNRSSIQFYENELQKLKNNNEKLNRKLDETLVTLNHCTELSSSTETEYLRNVLYNYMLGKEGLVLARVIAAVCKFDDDQTEAILHREQQKQTLMGQLGFR